MNLTPAFEGLHDVETGESVDPAAANDHDGLLDANYDLDAVSLTREALRRGPTTLDTFGDLLPFADLVSAGVGGTPLVDCPSLADELGVGRVLLKDEGRNPTGTVHDRELALGVTAAREAGFDHVGLSSTGDGGQAAAAAAARAGLTSHSYLPSRSTFINKAMVNVHGGDMRVVEGRLPQAREAFAAALADHGPDSDEPWYSLDGTDSPYRTEGAKTLAHELLVGLDFAVPDAVIAPFQGTPAFYGLFKGAREFARLGLTDGLPALYAAQAEGCAPLAEAFAAGADDVEPWDVPDTVCGGLERPDPPGAGLALSAVRETGGRVVTADDEAIQESAVAVAQREGIEMGASAGVAAAAAWSLADDLDAGATLVLVNTGAGSKDADLLRSHLMGQGW